jgi:dihydropteroate synthase
VTPDSFSDGGRFVSLEAALARAEEMIAEGADVIDVGGESTRPQGARAVDVGEELRRVVPVLESLNGCPVSIDTSKADVARRAIELGAEFVNDVTALRGDPRLAGIAAESGAYVCLMHMQGSPLTMQESPRYDSVVDEVAAFLEERLRAAVAAGIAEDRICLDPGIGFGKTVEHNVALVRGLERLAAIGRPILVGLSRKSALGRLAGDPQARVATTAASVSAAVVAYTHGAAIFRAHDVREHVEALRVAAAIAPAPAVLATTRSAEG